MKKLFMAVLALALMAGTSTVAQAQGGGQGGGNRMMAMLFQGITLSAAQQAKVDSITAKYREQMTAARQAAGDDRQAMMAKMGELRTKQNDEIKAVLTDEQKPIFDKNAENMRNQMRRPPGQ